jgi:signal transduction histidine kinase
MNFPLKFNFASYPRRLDRLVHSVRFRLMLWSLLMITLILIAFSFFIYSLQARDIQFDSINRVTRLERQAVSSLKGAIVFIAPQEDPLDLTAGTPHLPAAIDSSSNPVFQSYDIGALINSNNQVIQKIGPASDADLTQLVKSWSGSSASVTGPMTYWISYSTATGQTVSENYYFLLAPLSNDQSTSGIFLIGTPIDPDGRLPALALNLVLGSLAILLITLVGGYWLAGRVMRPLQIITHAAQKIGETDLRRRINLGTKDELGELADTFDQMLARLEFAFDRQRQFTADASHELRTPLTIIELETERALERRRRPEDYQQALQVIQSENETMARLVTDLLTLARMDAGQTLLKPEPLDLSDLALEVVERMQTLAQHRQVELTTGDLPEVPIQGDRQYLIQMLTNLVENAIKYAGDQDKTVRVETGCSQDRNLSRGWVRVIDNGPGIPPGHLPHLFDRFYRVDKARTRLDDGSSPQSLSSATSSGLGLAIVQWIAEAHGGKASVTSEVGKGSTFEIWLPLLLN